MIPKDLQATLENIAIRAGIIFLGIHIFILFVWLCLHSSLWLIELLPWR